MGNHDIGASIDAYGWFLSQIRGELRSLFCRRSQNSATGATKPFSVLDLRTTAIDATSNKNEERATLPSPVAWPFHGAVDPVRDQNKSSRTAVA